MSCWFFILHSFLLCQVWLKFKSRVICTNVLCNPVELRVGVDCGLFLASLDFMVFGVGCRIGLELVVEW